MTQVADAAPAYDFTKLTEDDLEALYAMLSRCVPPDQTPAPSAAPRDSIQPG